MCHKLNSFSWVLSSISSSSNSQRTMRESEWFQNLHADLIKWYDDTSNEKQSGGR